VIGEAIYATITATADGLAEISIATAQALLAADLRGLTRIRQNKNKARKVFSDSRYPR
jgi:hypothetical protein